MHKTFITKVVLCFIVLYTKDRLVGCHKTISKINGTWGTITNVNTNVMMALNHIYPQMKS